MGRDLIQFAEGEARRVGFDSIYLYTHERSGRPPITGGMSVLF